MRWCMRRTVCKTRKAFELAHKFAQRALSLAAKGSLSEAKALFSLGNLASDLSKYDAAVAHYEAALKIRKSLLGDDHVDVAAVYGNSRFTARHPTTTKAS
jgi:tetratricopeptide (TPR) repeat protein